MLFYITNKKKKEQIYRNIVILVYIFLRHANDIRFKYIFFFYIGNYYQFSVLFYLSNKSYNHFYQINYWVKFTTMFTFCPILLTICQHFLNTINFKPFISIMKNITHSIRTTYILTRCYNIKYKNTKTLRLINRVGFVIIPSYVCELQPKEQQHTHTTIKYIYKIIFQYR